MSLLWSPFIHLVTMNYDLKTIGFGGLVFLYDEKICGIRMFCLLDSQIMELKCCLYLIYSAWSSALWECRWMRKQKGLSQKEFVHRMCACRSPGTLRIRWWEMHHLHIMMSEMEEHIAKDIFQWLVTSAITTVSFSSGTSTMHCFLS